MAILMQPTCACAEHNTLMEKQHIGSVCRCICMDLLSIVAEQPIDLMGSKGLSS